MNAGAGGEREGLRGVSGSVEHDDDLGRPAAHALEAARQIRGLVFGHDDDGKLKRISHGASET
jgi:hypothetical protein